MSAVHLRLSGGIGNQLFQYSAARSIADKINCDLKIDLRWFYSKRNLESSNLPERSNSLIHFNNARFFSSSDYPNMIYEKDRNYIRHKIQKIFGYPKNIFVEKTFPFYDSSIKKVSKGMYLIGEFQSERYFKTNEKKLREDLKFTTPLNDANLEIKSQILELKNSVSIHIRRGDYLKPSINKRLATCTMEYYQNAANYISNNVSSSLHFFIFSNDPEWVKKYVNLDYKFTIVDINDEDFGHFDLVLQSLCSHNIIANSTMSWWAAWLNSNPDKIVVTPNKWYNSKRRKNPDIYQDHWVRL